MIFTHRIAALVYNESRRGYVALLSVIFISATGVMIMISVIAAGVNASRTDFATQQSGVARAMASSCAEEALQRILESGITSGTDSLTLASGTCSYTISSTGGQNITIRATGVKDAAMAKILVEVATTTPSIVLSSWQEVSDF
jgi:hypothetical protein